MAGAPVRPLLPRHLQIIYEINRRFLDEVRQRYPRRRRALPAHVDHRGGRRAAGAHGTLAIVGGHTVNGVAALHTRDPQEDVFRDFYELWPEKFNNKTNGITQRRWLLKCNPELSELITGAIGDGLGHRPAPA